MSSQKMTPVLLSFILILSNCIDVNAQLIQINIQLNLGFYLSSCPLAESIVKDEVKKAFGEDKGIAAGLVRLHFHDCFVRGCDGSVLIDSTPSNRAEKESISNFPTLRGFEVIDNAKKRIEAACKGIVSCADILAFAARDSVEITGGFGYEVPCGRKDGKVSIMNEALQPNLPGPFAPVEELTQIFASKGLTQEEMVILSGAHTIGRSRCRPFSSRLYNFSGTGVQDPTLDPTYVEQLKAQCPPGSANVVDMNPSSPNITDIAYYTDVLANRGLFTSDQTLLTNPATKTSVTRFAQDSVLWKSKFAAAMTKMGKIGIKTGDDGEIRANCRVINS